MKEENLKILKSRWKELKDRHAKFLAGALVTLAYTGVLYTSQCSKRPEPQAQSASPQLDTIIPRGYTLVPISVQNLESLDPIFGSHGIVDLYIQNGSGGGQKVASQLKMLRAPLNPSVFAVLVKSDSAKRIAGQAGPFFVVLHNRNADAGGVDIPVAPRIHKGLQIIEEEFE